MRGIMRSVQLSGDAATTHNIQAAQCAIRTSYSKKYLLGINFASPLLYVCEREKHNGSKKLDAG